MHRAVAKATGLKYDCVHKSLSGRKKAKRVRGEIKHCLCDWLRTVEAGGHIDVDEAYRGVPLDRMCRLLKELEGRYPTKEDVYRLIALRAGTTMSAARRYFQGDSNLKYAPLSVYLCTKDLVERGEDARRRGSYLEDVHTRQAAWKLARKVNDEPFADGSARESRSSPARRDRDSGLDGRTETRDAGPYHHAIGKELVCGDRVNIHQIASEFGFFGHHARRRSGRLGFGLLSAQSDFVREYPAVIGVLEHERLELFCRGRQ
jgi:hypothetical protein